MVTRAQRTAEVFPLTQLRQVRLRSKMIRQCWTPEERLWRVIVAAEKCAQLAPVLADDRR